MIIRKLTDEVSVAEQIAITDIIKIKALGFNTIVNNRPDGEIPNQPTSEEMKAATLAAGLEYFYIPMGREGASEQLINDTKKVLKNNSGATLCYCRTGNRSTILWALSQSDKLDKDEIIKIADAAGYDIYGLYI